MSIPVTEGFIPFRGFRTWYQIHGDLDAVPPGKFPILMLHGGPGVPHDYLDSLAGFAATGRPVIFYDQLGCGNSDRPDDPDMWEVATFLDELGVVRQALGLERILVVMSERSMFPPSVQSASADVLVTLFDEEGIVDCLQLAGELRAAGLRVEVYPEPDKLGKQFKYASTRGLRFVTIVGGDERAAGQVKIKDMSTGDQIPVARAEAPAWLSARFEPREAAARLEVSKPV